MGGVAYTVVAIVLLLLGVSALSDQLRVAMNKVLDVVPNPDQSLWYMFKKRISTLVIVFAFGVVLQLTVVLSWAITRYRQSALAILPSVEFIWHSIDLGISFGIVGALIIMIYKWLPDTDVAWRDVLVASF